jgi:S-DNA-T family DNA segregation ATPase FtsK/SpoIIIE
VGGDAAAAIAVDLRASGHLLVAGPPRSGRSTALLTVLAECLRTGLDVVVAAPHRSPVHERAKRLGVQVIGPETAAEAIDECPTGFAIVLVDDCEAFDDTAAGDLLTRWLRRAEPHLGAIVAGRTDELASAYRGVGAEARRNRSGVLLRPGPVDGDLFGVRLARSGGAPGPGRGVLVGTRCWTAGDHVASEWIPLDTREPVPIQIALTGPATPAPDQPPAMCGYR